MLQSQGRMGEAETTYRQALAIRRKRLGDDNTEVASSLLQLSGVLGSRNKSAEAETAHRQALALWRKQAGNDDVRMAVLLIEQANKLRDRGRFAQAELLARECLAIREAKIPDSWATFNARRVVGSCLMGQKKYTDAEPLLTSGYQGMKQREATIPPNAPRLKEAAQALVNLYEATGRPEQASQWKKTLDEMDSSLSSK